ncbi:MAG: AraC family transcriptional regulator [Pseudomonadota bacterium]
MALTDRIIWHIEMMLAAPFSLEELAARSGASPYHVVRCFRAASGMAPMTYLRARRLSVAAEALARGDADILSVALDAQYASHEAFTRAFAAYFGVLPSRVRGAQSTEMLELKEPLQMKNDMLTEVAAPEMREREAFRVVGLSAQCTFEDISAIPALWQGFNARESEVAGVVGAAYGVCCDGDGAGRFRYVAGAEAPGDAGMPDGMDDVAIPAGRYAVFTHTGHISDLPRTVYTIWNKALPDAGLEPRPAPDFEVYDKRFDVETGRGAVEIWIPVV